MGAPPKRVVNRLSTRQRRQGNNPKLKSDTNQAKVPQHKQGMVASIFRRLGISIDILKN